MDTCLLVGNGLNRTLRASISWGDLLADIANKYGVDYHSEIPMPMEFERIVNRYLSHNSHPSADVYTEFKSKIAEKICTTKLPRDAIHHELLNANPDAILTTNYDYFLEYAFNESYVHKGSNVKKYLFDATSIQRDVTFYHLHGMVSNPQSICLGYEHYAGIVQKLRAELNTKEKGLADGMAIKKVLFGEKKRDNSWGERFYTSNIAIIGLGLSSCEIDLWWLITHRAYLYYSDYCGLKEKIANQITYYDIIDDMPKSNKSDEEKRLASVREKHNIHLLLENSHIEVKKYLLSNCGGDYGMAYLRIIGSIPNDFS